MSRDMFSNTQQTPLMKAPSTPSMTPTRSVKRRSCVVNRPRHVNTRTMTMSEPQKEVVSCFSKSQPLCSEDFYHLRTRQVPISTSMSELWAQWGIHESSNHISPGSSQEEQEQSLAKDQKESRVSLSRCATFLGLLCLMVLSSFLGVLCYVHFFNTDYCSSPLQISQDGHTDRSFDQAIDSLQLESSVLRLSEELKHLKDHLSALQENVGSEVISSPQKGILEELLTADLACAGNLGSVLATPDTTTVTVPVTFTVLWLLSFHLQMTHRTPQTAIEGIIQEVGDCWPFQGSRGRLVLKLHRRSLLSGVSISHIPPSIVVSGDVSSAPRLFQVLVHRQEDDLESGRVLGQFEYKTSGAWRQTFPLDSSKTKEDLVDIVEFRFLENHGHPNYTCVYRVHVHGKTP